ncbi:MAG: hypothetical protein PVG30_06535 [Gammaproteobacteria bacterium]|jgi:serine/threonine protein kinase
MYKKTIKRLTFKDANGHKLTIPETVKLQIIEQFVQHLDKKQQRKIPQKIANQKITCINTAKLTKVPALIKPNVTFRKIEGNIGMENHYEYYYAYDSEKTINFTNDVKIKKVLMILKKTNSGKLVELHPESEYIVRSQYFITDENHRLCDFEARSKTARKLSNKLYGKNYMLKCNFFTHKYSTLYVQHNNFLDDANTKVYSKVHQLMPKLDCDLSKYIKKLRKRKLTHSFRLFKNIVMELKKLHTKGYGNSDLKLNNIMIKNDKLYLIDLEFAKKFGENICACTPLVFPIDSYVDFCKGKKPVMTKIFDIYSLGIIFLQIICSRLKGTDDIWKFMPKKNIKFLHKKYILKNDTNTIFSNHKECVNCLLNKMFGFFKNKTQMASQFTNLVRKMIDPKPDKRPYFDDIEKTVNQLINLSEQYDLLQKQKCCTIL